MSTVARSNYQYMKGYGQKGKFSRQRNVAAATRRGVARPASVVLVGSPAEMKYSTQTRDFTVPASTNWTATEADISALNCLFAPDRGTAINQRVGEKVTVYKIKIHGFVFMPKGATGAAIDACSVRLILFQDKQTNAAQAQGEQVMDATLGTDARDMNCAFMSDANFGRFKILRDEMITLENPSFDAAGATRNGVQVPFKMSYVFKKPVVVRFNKTNGATVADIVDNSFHLLCNGTTQDGAPALTYQVRVSYKDS